MIVVVLGYPNQIIMRTSKLATKTMGKNRNHHIWINGEIWWCNITIHHGDGTSERRRFSLKTKDVEVARRRRDNIFRDIQRYYLNAG